MFRAAASLTDAIDRLRRLDTAGGNIIGAMDPLMSYIDWIDEVEGYLRYLYAGEDKPSRLLTRRYWGLTESASPQFMYKFLSSEVALQRAYLRELVDEIADLKRIADRDGLLLVPDTNVLLHFQRVDHVDWHDVTEDSGPIRLVVPVLVLDELDEKRYTGSETIRKRARTALRPLNDRLAELEEQGFAELNDGVTVEYLLKGSDHRPGNPDADILGQVELLRQVTGREVTVATGDHGMRARAVARGLRVASMPPKYARDADEATGQVFGS